METATGFPVYTFDNEKAKARVKEQIVDSIFFLFFLYRAGVSGWLCKDLWYARWSILLQAGRGPDSRPGNVRLGRLRPDSTRLPNDLQGCQRVDKIHKTVSRFIGFVLHASSHILTLK